MSKTAEGLQRVLAYFEEYCTFGSYMLILIKPKLLFSVKGKNKANYEFKLYGKSIETQDSYSYLGIVFNYNGNFCTAREKLH